MEFSNEKNFKGAKDIKYLFYENTESDHLIVVFSGFPKPGSPPLYNYVRSLTNVKANKLFILDEYGAEEPRGCYYLGENRDLSVEVSVIALITHIANKHNVPFRKIIACGSSKGGYASLYFGIKYGFGYAVAGGPQILLGRYLLEQTSVTREVARFIAGGIGEEDKQYLNSLIFEVIENASKFPKMHIHVGKGEPHYATHVVPFIEALNKKQATCHLDLGDYDNHSELITHFPPYLLKTVTNITSKVEDEIYKS